MSPDRRGHGAGHDRFASGRSPRRTLRSAPQSPQEEDRAAPQRPREEDQATGQARAEEEPAAQSGHAAGGLALMRVGLPVTLAVGGVVLAVIGSALLGAALLTTALIAVLVGYFARLTIASNFERDAEEQARRTFRETGRWPRRRR